MQTRSAESPVFKVEPWPERIRISFQVINRLKLTQSLPRIGPVQRISKDSKTGATWPSMLELVLQEQGCSQDHRKLLSRDPGSL